jgi:hypothetical protein
MKQLKLERGKEELISTGGNYLCGHILQGLARKHLPEDFQLRREGAISDRDILLTMTGMICDGRSDFTNVNQYFEDTVFTQSFGIEDLPSEPTLRQRLDELPQARSHLALRQLSESVLKGRHFGTVRAGDLDLVPVDVDVSPLDNSGSNKQGVSFTYKKHDGYAPIFAYVGTEGFMLDHELRPGKQHCQEGTPQFIGSCVKTLETLGLSGRSLIRLDSGNDAEANFSHFGDNFFLIKRNLRKEKLEQWLATARRVGELQSDTREGKNVYTGFVDHFHPGGAKSKMGTVSIAFEVIERLIDHDGNRLLMPKIEVNTYWTNLPCAAEEVIALYHDHGTSEQFHSELKSDLGVEQLPSGKFCVNQIVMLCAMLAFNVLRTIGQEVIARAPLAPIKIKVRRWRLKTVLQNIVYCAVRVIRHAREIKLHFGKNCLWYKIIEDIARSPSRA